jgi:hypothetical protein
MTQPRRGIMSLAHGPRLVVIALTLDPAIDSLRRWDLGSGMSNCSDTPPDRAHVRFRRFVWFGRVGVSPPNLHAVLCINEASRVTERSTR